MATASQAPGVYVRYIPSGMRVIAPAGTSIAAFLGTADKDQPPNTPIWVSTWQEFEDKFVDLESTGDLPLLTDSVYGWFTNGGGPCYVCRIPATQDTLQPALTALEEKPDVTMVAVPGLSDIVGILPQNQPVQQGLVVSHCQSMGNRVALLDLPGGTPPQTQDAALDVADGGDGDPVPGAAVPGAAEVADTITLTATQATFATVYYPWLLAPSVYKNSTARYIPPSGHVAGTWARTDTERGVYKAPANVTVLGILGLEFTLTDQTQAPLNQDGINCLRTFPGQGSLVWGARTRAAQDPSDLDFRYVNIRRYVCFLDDSITQSTKWAVFEPNNAELQAKVAGAVSSFLVDQWRTGALVGATAPEAFYVVCDATNNTPVTMAEGNLFCDIGVALTRPAEFVYFRVTQTYS
jgi:phage tail sheath protein FI